MEGLKTDSAAARFLAAALRSERFVLVDVGCSGGFSTSWDVFGDRLEAYGLDASVAAIEHLRKDRGGSGRHYFAGLVGLPPDHPFHQLPTLSPPYTRNPWDRLAMVRTLYPPAPAEAQLQSEPVPPDNAPLEPDAEDAADRLLLQQNLWAKTELAEETIHLPELLAREGVCDIDFIKIDTDGPDFEILVSLEAVLDDADVLGLSLEVNFCGTDDANQHVFHNTDRFMRGKGFELFDLSVRKYAAAALPFPYRDPHPFPSRATEGRPYQGDALYVRDFGFPGQAERGARASPDKLLKLAALFAVTGHSDQAAEVLIQFRERLGGQLDVDRALDLLTRELHDVNPEVFSDAERMRTYRQYMDAFEADSPDLYGIDQRGHEAKERARRVEGALRDAEAELAAIRASTSWKATAWLRALRRMVLR